VLPLPAGVRFRLGNSFGSRKFVFDLRGPFRRRARVWVLARVVQDVGHVVVVVVVVLED